MRIKHGGQMPLPTNPKHGAGEYHAWQAKRAVCNLGGNASPTYVYPTPVLVTVKRRRRIATPATV